MISFFSDLTPTAPCSTRLLEICSLSLTLRGSDGQPLPVLEDINLSLNKSECLGIAGESGSGKSVLALSILRLLSSKSIVEQRGSILFEGNPLLQITEAEMREIRGNSITMVFQEPMSAMNPLLTLSEQIGEIVWAHRPKLSQKETKDLVEQALLRAGFQEPSRFLSSYPHQLSGGMRQRAMIAMALVMEPKLVLADEPTTALDAALQVQLLSNLRENIKKHGHSLLFISHDLGIIRSIADELAILYSGQIMEIGKATTVITQPAHPYTAALIEAMPRLIREKCLPRPIPGSLPSPNLKPKGCVFSDRCKKKREECHSAVPPLKRGTSGRNVRCFFPENEL